MKLPWATEEDAKRLHDNPPGMFCPKTAAELAVRVDMAKRADLHIQTELGSEDPERAAVLRRFPLSETARRVRQRPVADAVHGLADDLDRGGGMVRGGPGAY